MLTLLNNENLHQGKHVSRSKSLKELSFPLLSILSDVLARGVKQKVFRPDVDPHDLYISMCALGYFYLSNRFTLSAFLGTNLMTAAALNHWPEVIETAMLRLVMWPKEAQERSTRGAAAKPELAASAAPAQGRPPERRHAVE
jgi:hypothetical protein